MITRELFTTTVQRVCTVVGADVELQSAIIEAMLPLAAAGGMTTSSTVSVDGFDYVGVVQCLVEVAPRVQ